jgi:hypothetical protein
MSKLFTLHLHDTDPRPISSGAPERLQQRRLEERKTRHLAAPCRLAERGHQEHGIQKQEIQEQEIQEHAARGSSGVESRRLRSVEFHFSFQLSGQSSKQTKDGVVMRRQDVSMDDGFSTTGISVISKRKR